MGKSLLRSPVQAALAALGLVALLAAVFAVRRAES